MGILTAEFAKAAAKARPAQWHRPQLATLQASRQTARREDEKRLLRQIMRQAKGSPVAQAALAWAKAHKIKFIIDYNTTAGGYYTRQSGVVAISRPAAEGWRGRYYAVEVLVHELRHAWQDHQRLLPHVHDYHSADLARITIQQALYEADAYAHGKLAAAQCEGEVGSPRNYLRYHFRNWYAGSMADIYVSHQREYQGASLRIGRCKFPNYQTEFKAGYHLTEARAGLDPWRREDIEKLGKSFADFNYLSNWKEDRFWKRILSPSHAVRQFADAGRAGQVAEAVRKQQLTRHVLLRETRRLRQGGASARKLPG